MLTTCVGTQGLGRRSSDCFFVLGEEAGGLHSELRSHCFGNPIVVIFTPSNSVLGGERRHWAIIGLFFCIIMLSIGFEETQHALKHYLKETGQKKLLTMLDAMFKELTILGFVGLTLMVMVKTGVLKAFAVVG